MEERITLAYLVIELLEISTQSAQAKKLSSCRFSIFKLYIWHWLVGRLDWDLTVQNVDYGKVLRNIAICLQPPPIIKILLAIKATFLKHVTCGVRGKLDPPCNAVGYIDRKVLGINHMYHHPAWRRSKSVDPPNTNKEELIFPIFWCPLSHSSRLKNWVVMGPALLVLGMILHFTNPVPLNKQLCTLSYVCVISEATALVF
ncbi:unnamed protein product [Thlaspi arvense]|uniref:Uncharacterized protein n=1 Tax=Thlaspi arvense TaxID=13288 RepID=A0AAU9RRR9_THLAR|nr:unnamed protein product [Thlaspi arvense]